MSILIRHQLNASALSLSLVVMGVMASAHAGVKAGVSSVSPSDEVTSEGMTDRVIVKYKDSGTVMLPSKAALAKAQLAGNRQGVQVSHFRRTGLGSDVLKLNKKMTV